MSILTDDFIDEALVRFARGTRKDFARYIERAVMEQYRPTPERRQHTFWENLFGVFGYKKIHVIQPPIENRHFIVKDNRFEGLPPIGFANWKEYFKKAWESNPFILRGLRISALDREPTPKHKSVLDMTPKELYHEYLDAGPDYELAITLLRNDTKQATLDLMSGTVERSRKPNCGPL